MGDSDPLVVPPPAQGPDSDIWPDSKHSEAGSKTTGPSREASMIFGIVTAVAAALGVLGVVVLALLERPHAAAVLLGCGMVMMGLLRGAWPGRPWFSARNRWFDALVFALVGVAILWLSPWTAQIPPA